MRLKTKNIIPGRTEKGSARVSRAMFGVIAEPPCLPACQNFRLNLDVADVLTCARCFLIPGCFLPHPKSTRFNTPNSTLELGSRPLNWVENSLSPPQFNPASCSFASSNPFKNSLFQDRQASHKPRHTKKLKAAVESGNKPPPSRARRKNIFHFPNLIHN